MNDWRNKDELISDWMNKQHLNHNSVSQYATFSGGKNGIKFNTKWEFNKTNMRSLMDEDLFDHLDRLKISENWTPHRGKVSRTEKTEEGSFLVILREEFLDPQFKAWYYQEKSKHDGKKAKKEKKEKKSRKKKGSKRKKSKKKGKEEEDKEEEKDERINIKKEIKQEPSRQQHGISLPPHLPRPEYLHKSGNVIVDLSSPTPPVQNNENVNIINVPQQQQQQVQVKKEPVKKEPDIEMKRISNDEDDTSDSDDYEDETCSGSGSTTESESNSDEESFISESSSE